MRIAHFTRDYIVDEPLQVRCSIVFWHMCFPTFHDLVISGQEAINGISIESKTGVYLTNTGKVVIFDRFITCPPRKYSSRILSK